MALPTDDPDPKTLNDALNGSESEKWKKAILLEYAALEKTRTLTPITPNELSQLQAGQLKWAMLKRKRDSSGAVSRHKVRLVVQGFLMQPGIDYDDTFAPCACMTTIR